MQSLRSKILLSLVHNRHLFGLKLTKPLFDPSPEGIETLRRQANQGSAMFGKPPKGVEIVPAPVKEMYAEYLIPENSSNEKVILYFHGGMYICGSPQGHRIHVAKFTTGSGVAAFVFDYRLAPEHPFPAAIDDSIKAYSELLDKGYRPENIRFAGDSAGGGLCLAALLAIKEKGLPLPLKAVVLSPWTDLALTGKSYVTNIESCLSPHGSAQNCSRFYAGDYDPKNPLISPLYGDLKDLPPISIYAGENEILRDDSIAFAQRAREAGVQVTLTVEKGMCHCYPAFSPLFPEAKRAMNEICEFLKQP
ncbi:MAG: alpha/beta hydrolase [Deltaproteobacteria bacterium]|nr:alpha/beta hydrolase [Deltaproteobacteria bacterium]